MKNTPLPPLGSPDWVEHVFKTDPVRNNKGRTKHTQFHEKEFAVMNRRMGGQGRNEACGLLALEYLAKLGLVTRFKEQPFATDTKAFGAEIVPDCLAELRDKQLLVIELKTERFLTRPKQLVLDENRTKFSEFGLKYLVWTDQRPLNHAARHHLINMNRFAGEDIPAAELDGLVHLIDERRILTLEQVYAAGYDKGCIYVAAWAGRIFFSITAEFTLESRISATRRENLEAIFLDCQRSTDTWWKSLP